MLIYSIFSGFKRKYKGKQYGSILLKEAAKQSKEEKKYHFATVNRKGSLWLTKTWL